MLGLHRFGPAIDSEETVFGAARPGYPGGEVGADTVEKWLAFMKSNGIQRVVCLLRHEQLAYYDDIPEGLLQHYRNEFGAGNVLSAPIEDYHLSSPENLQLVMSFLDESDQRQLPTVIHCSGGSGRTGHALAAWLVHTRGYDAEAAIAAVGRNPKEAVRCGNATERELIELLNIARAKMPEKEA